MKIPRIERIAQYIIDGLLIAAAVGVVVCGVMALAEALGG